MAKKQAKPAGPKKQITSAGRILRGLGAEIISGDVLKQTRQLRAGFKPTATVTEDGQKKTIQLGSPAKQEAAWLEHYGPGALEAARHAGRKKVTVADFQVIGAADAQGNLIPIEREH